MTTDNADGVQLLPELKQPDLGQLPDPRNLLTVDENNWLLQSLDCLGRARRDAEARTGSLRLR